MWTKFKKLTCWFQSHPIRHYHSPFWVENWIPEVKVRYLSGYANLFNFFSFERKKRIRGFIAFHSEERSRGSYARGACDYFKPSFKEVNEMWNKGHFEIFISEYHGLPVYRCNKWVGAGKKCTRLRVHLLGDNRRETVVIPPWPTLQPPPGRPAFKPTSFKLSSQLKQMSSLLRESVTVHLLPNIVWAVPYPFFAQQ